jgi:hypothetical protein
MKTVLIWFLGATTLTLAAVCVMQTHKFSSQQQQLAALRAEEEVKAQQIEDLQAAQKHFDKQRRELMSQANDLATQLQAREAAATNVVVEEAPKPAPLAAAAAKPDSDKGGFGQMLSKMMKDPATRDMIRAQQKLMMDQMYTPLMKKLNLTPEETAQFKDMLSENVMKAADKATSALGGLDSTNSADTFKALSAEQKTFDEQVKAFLGDDRYAQYKDYQETVGERTLLNQFKMLGNDWNMNDQQTEALLGFMKEEQKRVAADTGLPLGQTDNDPSKLQGLFADGKIDSLLQAQETVGSRVYDRARTILSPDQLDTLGRYQTNRMQMMRMGMNMMRGMFGSGQSGNPPTPSNP